MESELFRYVPEGTVPMISSGGFINMGIFFEGEAEKQMHDYPGLGIPQRDICLIFRNGYENIVYMNIAKESFQVTGLLPANQDVLFF